VADPPLDRWLRLALIAGIVAIIVGTVLGAWR
jgi:hypothetical protein